MSSSNKSIVGNINGAVKGLLKNQDLIFYGETVKYHWSVVLDGHGTNRFKDDVLMKLNWEEIMSTDDPSETVIQLVKNENGKYGYSSGSTMSLMRMYENRVETYNIGDSITAIYKNGELVYKNAPHNKDNLNEIKRLENNTVIFTNTMNTIPHIASATELHGKYNSYCRFNKFTKLAVTQALGHNDVTGYCCEKHVEYYEPSDIIRCVSGSDGFFDMFMFSGDVEEDVEHDKMDILTKTSDELLEKIENRWKQKWDYYPDLNNVDFKFDNIEFPSDSYDDISIIVWDNYTQLKI